MSDWQGEFEGQPTYGEIYQDEPLDVELPVWGEVGEALQAAGEWMQTLPNSDLKHLGKIAEGLGEGMATSDMAAEAVLDAWADGKSAGEVAGALLGAIAGAALPALALGTLNGLR